MTPVFEVLQPGVLSTIQDLGRTGWQRMGVGTAGAMDRFAIQVANLLVGNVRGEGALEIGLGGLRLRCREDWIIAVCGADLGSGIPLYYPMSRQIDLELRECKPFQNGCIYVTYRVKN